jgi:hypothetical protein
MATKTGATNRRRGRKPKVERYERLTITLPPKLLQVAMERLALPGEGKSELVSRVLSEALVRLQRGESANAFELRLRVMEARLSAIEARNAPTVDS